MNKSLNCVICQTFETNSLQQLAETKLLAALT